MSASRHFKIESLEGEANASTVAQDKLLAAIPAIAAGY